MAWYRAAFMALAAHGLVLFFFIFTLKGSPEIYKVDVVFWGSILRLQDVSWTGASLSSGFADVKDEDLPEIRSRSLSFWRRGVEVDKPDLFQNVLAVVEEDRLRFSGERVELDAEKAETGKVEGDMIAVPPVKMRLERP